MTTQKASKPVSRRQKQATHKKVAGNKAKADQNETSKRMSFHFGQASLERLEEVKELTSATTYTEVLRNALLLYEDYVKSPSEGFEYYKRRIDENNRPVILSGASIKSRAL